MISKAISQSKSLLRFFKYLNISPRHLFFASCVSFVSAIFGGLAIKMMILLLTSVIDSSASSNPRIQYLTGFLHISPSQSSFSSQNIFLMLLGLMLGCVIVKAILDYGANVLISRQTHQANIHMRSIIFKRFMKFGKLYYDQAQVGTVSTTIMKVATQLSSQIKDLHRLIAQSMTLTVYLVIMVWISWKLTLIALILLPFINISNIKLAERVRAMARKHGQSEVNLMNKVINTISCMNLVKISGAEQQEIQNMEKVSLEELESEYELEKTQNLLKPVTKFITTISLLMLLVYIKVGKPTVTPQEISQHLVFIWIVRRALPNFGLAAQFMVTLARSQGAIDRFNQILIDKDKHIVHSGSHAFSHINDGIRIQNLNFEYRPGIMVLKNIDAFIPANKITAIIGPTGAGKTTLVHLIARFYDCAPNTILVDQMDIRDYDTQSLMRHISFVTQENVLFDETIRYNVLYGCKREVLDSELLLIAEKVQLTSLLNRLPQGLDSRIGERGVQLSGGEKQKIAMARALLSPANLLIFDEATSAWDYKTENEIQTSIRAMYQNRTVIIIAHRLSSIMHADQIIVLEDGAVVESGVFDELLARNGRFSDYWNAQRVSNKDEVYENKIIFESKEVL